MGGKKYLRGNDEVKLKMKVINERMGVSGELFEEEDKI